MDCAGAVLPLARGCARSTFCLGGSFSGATEKVGPGSPGRFEGQAANICPPPAPAPRLTKSRGEGKARRTRGRSPDTLATIRSSARPFLGGRARRSWGSGFGVKETSGRRDHRLVSAVSSLVGFLVVGVASGEFVRRPALVLRHPWVL